jgi:hypothetical protein
VCSACGLHATNESTSLLAGHRFPRAIILLVARYYLQLGTRAERIAGSWLTVASTSAAE